MIEALRDRSPGDTIVAAGVGQHQMWTSQFWQFDHPYTWVNSGGLGTMGYAVPAAIGAKVGEPTRTVWAVDGDGCFQMTAQELITAAAERIPVKIAIINNAYLGMVRQWQELFYEERYSEVYLSPDLPDYVKWAEAMGCVGIRVSDVSELDAAVDKANSITDRPGRGGVPLRRAGEGVPDGARRQVQRRDRAGRRGRRRAEVRPGPELGVVVDADEARRRLAAHDHGVLATAHPTRGVDAVPAAYAVVGDRLAVPVDVVKPKASTRLQRERNLETDPRATLVVEHWDAADWSTLWWVRASLRWRAEPTDDEVEALAAALEGRYPQYAGRPFARGARLRDPRARGVVGDAGLSRDLRQRLGQELAHGRRRLVGDLELEEVVAVEELHAAVGDELGSDTAAPNAARGEYAAYALARCGGTSPNWAQASAS